MPRKFQGKDNYRVGVISDTHGKIPQSALNRFKGVDLIIHAGDIGEPEILQALTKIAPTVAVRGNMDTGKWARDLPEKEIIAIGKTVLYVLHDLHKFDSNPDQPGYRVIINGHTHRALTEENRGVLYLNPGSAVLPKFGDPATIALLQINGDTIDPRIIALTSKY
jgi:putative phosphoesterase